MAEIVISEDLIQLSIHASEKEEVIRLLADKLYALDYVRPGYYENVIIREKEYPTGLPTAIPVAICHTEAQFVKKSALAVGTLAEPVAFHEMGSPERDIQAEIVFLMALNDPKDQVPCLKRMVSVFKNREALETIKSAADPKQLAEYLKGLLLD